MSPDDIAQQVLIRRRQLRLSQTKLAEMAGISRNYVSMIERGEARNISIGVLQALCTALGISPTLLTGTTEEEPTFIPPALRQLALQIELQFDTVDRLARIPRRGKEPHSPDEWAELYYAVRPYLE